MKKKEVKVGSYIWWKNKTYGTLEEGTVIGISNGFFKVAPISGPYDVWVLPSEIDDVL